MFDKSSSGVRQSKNIYVGSTRIATQNSKYGDSNTSYENYNTYYYHADHLGSAQLITDYKGDEYERIEYTPYGELWIEKVQSGCETLPYRFTGKEMDDETGLYYYGARYLDSKYSHWISPDPALSSYLPQAPVNDDAKKNNQNLPGNGGVFNTVNMQLYHYAGNNPVKYTDPDGKSDLSVYGAWLPLVDGPLPIGDVIEGALVLYDLYNAGVFDNVLNAAEGNNDGQDKTADQAKTGLEGSAQSAAPNGSGDDKTKHGEQRAQEGRSGDPNRNVGDTNRIKNEGKHYHDNNTGNEVYVKGNKVYIENEDGQEVSQFHNSKANTQTRIDSGRWEPVEN